MRLVMSMNTDELVAPALLANTRTTPPFSTTNQRELSPGACSIAIGCVKLRFAKARDSVRLAVLLAGGSNAKQVVLLGRESSPMVEALVLLKAALTLRAASMLTVQLPVPLQLPPQPAKVEPLAGVALSVTLVPSA